MKIYWAPRLVSLIAILGLQLARAYAQSASTAKRSDVRLFSSIKVIQGDGIAGRIPKFIDTDLPKQTRPARRAGFSLMPSNNYGNVSGVAFHFSATAAAASLQVLGGGTVGRLTKWTGITSSNSFIGDSTIFESKLGLVGIGTDTPTSKLTVAGTIQSLSGGFQFPDGTVQTTSATGALFEVVHNATLSGDGTSGSPLGVAIPLVLIGPESGSVIRVINTAEFGRGAMSIGGPGGDGVFASGGASISAIGGRGLIARGGTGSSVGGDGVSAAGGDSDSGLGGLGVATRGGNSGGGAGGAGVLATGGGSDSQTGGDGVRANGGVSVSGSGGRGMSANGASSSSSANGGDGVVAFGGTSDSGNGGDGVIAFGGFGTGVGKSGGTGIEATGGSGVSGGTDGLAGKFFGDVEVTGNLSKGGGSFKIDHPLDPENKYLYHSFVESPEMKNIYDGNITTDGNSEAVVELPDYFDALNRDFRYQLTVIGTFAQAIVADEIKDNRFVIRTSAPNVKVSWQVTGVRRDHWAEKNRIPVEVQKPERERGYYLHPEVFNQPEERGLVWGRDPELMQQRKQREIEHKRKLNNQ